MRHFLFTFTDGTQTFYIFVATPNNSNARSIAFTAVEMKLGTANHQGLQFVKQLRTDAELDDLVKYNEHYNLNLQAVDDLMNKQEEGASCGEWVKD